MNEDKDELCNVRDIDIFVKAEISIGVETSNGSGG